MLRVVFLKDLGTNLRLRSEYPSSSGSCVFKGFANSSVCRLPKSGASGALNFEAHSSWGELAQSQLLRRAGDLEGVVLALPLSWALLRIILRPSSILR